MNHVKLAYLNERFLAPDEARVSAFDRGFMFGDGVYEVIPVYGYRPFRVGQHLERLDNSLAAVGLHNPLTHDQWESVFQRLIEADDAPEQSIYLQITRGPAQRDHSFPPNPRPTVFAYAQPMSYPDAALVKRGVDAVTLSDVRWLRCDIKSIALLANVLLRQQAVESGAAEAILLRDGLVTEGAASNIFVVLGDTMLTPPKGAFILPGITRDLVVELAAQHGVPCSQRDITEDELRTADEVWMTSSTREILPVTRIDGQPVGAGVPGPMHARMFAYYQQYKQDFREGRVD